jgi:hypothetical protein
MIETMRFVFGHGRDRIKELLIKDGLIEKTLGGGTAKIELNVIEEDATTRMSLERERFDDTRIFVDDVREHTSREVLEHIDIFSQNDLQEIADNDQMRIGLIDRAQPRVLAKLRANREEQTAVLQEIGAKLRTIRVRISTLRQQIQPLALLRQQLQAAIAATPILPPELEQERGFYIQRTKVTEAFVEIQKARDEAVRCLGPIQSLRETVRTLVQQISEQKQPDAEPAEELARSLVDTLTKVAEIRVVLEQLTLDEARESLNSTFEGRNARYYELRREQNHINDGLKQQQHLLKQIGELESLSAELAVLLTSEVQLLAERTAARNRINVIDSEIFSIRVAEVDRINAEHSERVFLSLETGVGTESYRQKLSSMLGGSRIRNQDDVAAELAQTFPAAILVDCVESGSGQQFATVLKRDLAQMNRVVAHLSDHPDLYQLEAESPASRLEITFYDGSEPKPVEALSGGQKATALLPLILRPLPYPLIVDQPEDDLDNSFIFNSLVQTIRSLKSHRQLIFVTHNANIPVLGEADEIVVMSMATPTRAAAPIVGSVEECKHHILELLEGGKEAFLEREARYRDLIHP